MDSATLHQPALEAPAADRGPATTPVAGAHPLLAGTRVNSLGTFVSRVLGMVRDASTAALLGLAGGGVMDAFVTAFRWPNTFRRLLGEGALAASYLPVLSERLDADRRAAWQLASTLLAGLAVVLGAITLLGEAGFAAAAWLGGAAGERGLLLGLSAVLWPYLFCICLAAQLAATLQAAGRFSVPALAPAVLNICWLVGVWCVAPWFGDRQAQVYVIAGSVLLAGVLQAALQWWALRRLGFRFDCDFAASRAALRRIVAAMLPMTLGLAITQLNTLLDSVVAWGLAAPPGTRLPLPGGAGLAYPLTTGAAASIYYGERLYEFPAALLGLAVATAIYPLLSRHAARGDQAALGQDLSLGLRLVTFLGVPAAVGMTLLAEPVVRLLFERGHFTADDTLRTARVVACYGWGVAAYCALPAIVRGYYAVGDRVTPVKVGAAMVVLNLALDLTLVWPLAEAGLALSTAVCAALQTAVLLTLLARRRMPLAWRHLGATLLRAIGAAAAMAAMVAGTWNLLGEPGGTVQNAINVLVSLAVAGATYLSVYRVLGGREGGMLARG